MANARVSGTILTLALLSFASPLIAQARSTVDPVQLGAAVSPLASPRAEAIRTVLSTPKATAAASLMGIRAADLSARLAALDAASLEQLARQAGAPEEPLAGGDSTIVISTTTVIIALLLLILLTD